MESSATALISISSASMISRSRMETPGWHMSAAGTGRFRQGTQPEIAELRLADGAWTINGVYANLTPAARHCGAIVAVGTTITDRPPHRSVRARWRIRLLPWMSGGEAN